MSTPHERRWCLPTAAEIGGRCYVLNTDYREVLGIIAWLDGTPTDAQAEPCSLDAEERWYIALTLFYRGFAAMPQADYKAAVSYLTEFLSGGAAPQPPTVHPQPKLLDWQQDAALIAAGVNRAAGCEVRALPYLHWWTFLAWFSSIGDGTLATVVAIRDKLHRGKRLEPWELSFYRTHRAEVELRPRATDAERAERARLNALLK